MGTWTLIGLMTLGCSGGDTDTTETDTGNGGTQQTHDTDNTGDTSGAEDTQGIVGSDSDGPGDTSIADSGATHDTESGKTEDSGGSVEPPEKDPCEGREVGILVGQCASNFALVDNEDTTHELHAYEGRVILLDFSGFT